MTFPTPDFGIDEKNLHYRLHPTSQTRGDPKAEGSLCLKWFENIQGVFFLTGTPLKIRSTKKLI